jgi:hypothetical protein
MKFIFADSMDYVDPHFNFLLDRNGEGRRPYWDDQFPHEILGYAPYDGMLVSRAIVGDHRQHGKYTEAQAMRFRRIGARKFLRLDKPAYSQLTLMGDCGAFSYASMDEPPYTPADTVEFYADGGFTHGCSIDHIIFEFDATAKGFSGGSDQARDRCELTLELADAFLKASRALGAGFTPIGVVQGWSPGSMAEAARRLLAMGYRYLGIGGLVPLRIDTIHAAVAAVDDVVRYQPGARMHLLGFARVEEIEQFSRYRVASFDTTSPLLRAFKDKERNYYLPGSDGRLQYFTAIRIPQVFENNALKRQVQMGRLKQESLVKMEALALDAVRRYSQRAISLDTALSAILSYARPVHWSANMTEDALDRRMAVLGEHYRRTLLARAWERCSCSVCASSSVEVIIFRGSNRNKRRGIHNMGVFRQHLQDRLAA